MSESPTSSHIIQLHFPSYEPKMINKKSFRLKTFDKLLSYISPSHFGSKNIRKIQKMKSVILSRKISKYKRLYEMNITNSYQTLIDYEIYNGFNAFCSCFKANTTLTTLNLSSVIIDPLLMIRLIKSFESHATLKHLDISNNSMISLVYKYAFKCLKYNKKLESLNLFNSPLHNEIFRDLNDLLYHNKSIKEINFNFAQMDSDSLKFYFDTLAHTSGMKSVKLANKTLNYSALVGLSYYFSKSPKPKLNELDLSYCNISVREIQIMMKHMPVWKFCRKKSNLHPEIHKISFGGNRINGKNSVDSFNYLIDQIQNIYSLDLTKNQIAAFDLILLAVSFQKIQYSLNLSHNRFNENFPENIDFLCHLKILNLSYNNLSDVAIQVIAKTLATNPNWSHLNISNNNIGNKDLRLLIKALETNRNLMNLNLAQNEISDKGLLVFEEMMSILQIRELDLSYNDIGILGMMRLFPITKKGPFCLKEVRLEEIYFYEDQFSKDANLEMNLKFLEVLSMQNSIFLSDQMIKYLVQADSLKELNLNGSALDENLLPLSKFMFNSRSLKVLRMRNVGLGAIKASEMAHFWNGLKECQLLETLDISKNKLAKYLNEFIECAKKLKNLISLDLSSNLLENEHAFSLAGFIKNSTIKDLNLSNNLFSYMAFESLSRALVDNVYLTSLKLGKMHLDILCLIPLGRFIARTPCLETLDLSETVFNTTSILELNRKEKGALKELSFNYMNSKGSNIPSY